MQRALARLHLDVAVVERVGEYPSPTVLVDGIDVVTTERLQPGARCRLDLPAYEQLLAVLGP